MAAGQAVAAVDLFQRIGWLWRLCATALAYTVFGLGGLIVPLLAIPLLYLLPGGRKTRQRYARRIVHWLFLSFVYFMRLLGILSWRVEGLEKLRRERGRLLLANHPTLLDVVFLIAFVPNATCIVKSRLRANPAMSGFIALTGYIANDDGPDLIESARAAMRDGSVLIIFPEGTRTTPGKPMTLRRGAANIAVRCAVNITPVVIQCSPPTLSKQHKWYHIPERAFTMSFQIGDDLSVAPFADGVAALGSRKLTDYLKNYFTKETELHVGKQPKNRIESAYYRDTGA